MEEQQEKQLEAVHTETTENATMEPILISDAPSRKKKKQHADDILMTQCIFCILLVLSIFVLHWINGSFASSLQQAYVERLHAPAPEWIADAVRQVEQWITK